ncbi:TPA: hypothetical protein ACMDTO_000151 [Vibrio cholerae]|uniref:hypothetical protein n=1 Tax=Vibrio cholerae TaxID=666 RepID=UPI001D6DE7E3|nr:hypothetical protein [Vibrio cholerae]EGR4280986.1 hypothetical protein [Vibrio cholerae]
MNYETATDRELNDKLLEMIHGEVVRYWHLSDDETYIYDCGPTGEDFHKIDIKDYCTDWNATMPLMIEHGLTLSPVSWPEECIGQWGCETNDDRDISVFLTDPLRAVVVCLIKILESKHERT